MKKITPYSTVTDLIKLIMDYERSNLKFFSSDKLISDLFKDMLTFGYDYFEFLRIFCQAEQFKFADADDIINLCPVAYRIQNISVNTIRMLIPHWTASKYHTAPIDEVVEDIRRHVLQNDIGNYVYNSNRNTKNPKSYNDIYILLITETKAVFLDLNRRTVSELSHGGTYDSGSNL